MARGGGIRTRIKLSLEEFILPQLLKKVYEGENPIEFNLIGHSRGAITAITMTNCLKDCLDRLREGKINNKEFKIILKKCFKDKSELELDKIQNDIISKFKRPESDPNHINCKVKLVAFDPVEGPQNPKDFNKFGSIPSFDIKVKGLGGKKVRGSYESVPDIITESLFVVSGDEKRAFFPLMIPNAGKKTSRTIRRVLGDHITMAGAHTVHKVIEDKPKKKKFSIRKLAINAFNEAFKRKPKDKFEYRPVLPAENVFRSCLHGLTNRLINNIECAIII